MSKVATWQVLSASAAVLLVSALVVQASMAAFSGTTDTPGDWASGTVALSDDDGTGTVAFTNDQTMVPGDSDQACVTVTYDGDTATSVKLYGSTTFTSGSDLGQYLDLTIEEVTIGTGSCGTPDTVTSIYSGTLSVNTGAFAVDHTDWSTGLASNWAPSASGETQVYRLTATLQDDNNAQSLDSTATFNWEAQNT